MILLFSVTLLSCGKSDSTYNQNYVEDEENIIPEYQVTLRIESLINYIFSKYDLKVYLDDDELGIIKMENLRSTLFISKRVIIL